MANSNDNRSQGAEGSLSEKLKNSSVLPLVLALGIVLVIYLIWDLSSANKAPQAATPQPNFVPVSFNSSRMTHRRGVPSGADTLTDFPFILIFVAIKFLLSP